MTSFAYRHLPAAVISAHGEDAQDYLQSQWSVNLALPGENRACYGLRLNRKGRVLADAFLLRHDSENFVIASYDSNADYLLKLLEENVVADDVDFSDQTKGMRIVTIWGDQSSEVMEALEINMPERGFFRNSELGMVFMGRKTCPENIDFLTNETQIQDLDSRLRSIEGQGLLRFCRKVQLEQSRMKSGIPAIPAEIGEADLPQEAGLEKVAVDFDKGCYLGQEVMARIHAMGKVQRKLSRVQIDAMKPLKLPKDLFIGSKKIGSLRSCVAPDESSSDVFGMAMIRRAYLHEADENGISLEPSSSPEVTIISQAEEKIL